MAASSRARASPDLPPLIVIAGATATGKTALSLALAKRIERLEIISADSRQVYRGMDIGTAKADAADRAVIPHHCLDLVDPDAPFSAADYQRAALAALGDIAYRGGIGCLVGGTGLYLRAIARGLPLDEDAADAETRVDLEASLADHGLDHLVARLRAEDPETADRMDLRNPRRVVRALERLAVTGSALPPEPVGYPAPVIWLGLQLPRHAHRAAIRERVIAQFDAGLLDEADRLRSRYSVESPAFSALGYREAFDVLDGRTDLAAAIDADAARTWAYARRQRTWFRSEPGIIPLEGGAGDLASAILAIEPFMRGIEHAEYAGYA